MCPEQFEIRFINSILVLTSSNMNKNLPTNVFNQLEENHSRMELIASMSIVDEPYTDHNNNGEYDKNLNEEFVDINNNGILDTVEVNDSWNGTIGGNADGPPDEVYLYRPGGTSSLNGNLLGATFSSGSGKIQLNDGTDPSSFLVETFIDENENGIYDIGEIFTDENSDGMYGDMAGGLHLKNIGEAG